MKIHGRVINAGSADGEAVVLDIPFSFIGDLDVSTGDLVLNGHPLNGKNIAGKILVCPTGKGGTIAPFIAYEAMLGGTAPAAILCDRADPMLCECALVMDIPIMDGFSTNPSVTIRTGQKVRLEDGFLFIED